MDVGLPPFWPTVVVIAFLVSVSGVAWLSRHRWSAARARLSDRFILGVPWGSIIVIGFVLAVYLFVQDGITDFDRPIVYPFVNWSYLYPKGVFLAAFSHGGANHLIGNLTTAAVLAPLAEYIWGHYPRPAWGRVSTDRTRRPWHRPGVRAVLIVPGVLLGVGLLTSLFTWGPVIGFSGVVYALAGFTVVRFPIVTLIALLFRSAVRELGATLFEPVVEATTSVSMSTPAWVGVAFQGHGLGFLVGAFLGILLLHRRNERVDPLRLWFGLVLVMIATSLWAIWGSRGSDVFVLYRGLGFTLVFLVALLLTLAVASSDRSLIGWLTRRRLVLIALGLSIVAIAGVAIPFNLVVVTGDTTPEHAVDVAGYDVFYGEDIESPLRPLLVPGDEPTNVSGLVLADPDRYLWTPAVDPATLAHRGAATIALGDAFERAEVTANRTAWAPVGNSSVYRVHVEHGEAATPVFASEARQANVTLAGHHVAVMADRVDGFHIQVIDPEGETVTAPFPTDDEVRELRELEFVREGDQLIAAVEGTEVPVARRE